MSNSDKPAAKSGERRQPRLMDVQRLQSTVDELTGKVKVLEAMVAAQADSLAKSPFAELTFEQICTGIAYGIAVLQPGGSVLDYQVGQRMKRSIRALKAVMTGDESLYEDKPERRERVQPGAKVTPVEPIAAAHGEPVTVTGKQTTAQRLGLTPPRR